jgi:CelD/BcsL family acetyltransferase involved in cellulose biosynthesis
VKVTLYTDAMVFDELQSEWNDLLRRSTHDNVFCTLQWQATWWKSYQAGQLWVLTCRADNGLLVGIGSWFIQHANDERVVRTIGCVTSPKHRPPWRGLSINSALMDLTLNWNYRKFAP